MIAIYFMVLIALIIVPLLIWLYFWALNDGQYDDLESPADKILFDEEIKHD